MIRLAIAISHPIQYHAPLYAHLARDGRFDLRVFFMSDRGARAYYDSFAKTMVQFDNPVLQGYSHQFLRTGEPRNKWQQRTEFVQFGLTRELARWAPDAVYFHGYDNPAFWPAMWWCRRNRVAVLFRGENEDVLPRPRLRSAARELFLRMLMPRIDAFLYIGVENHEFFRRRGIPESKLFYVPYSVDNGYFLEGIDAATLARYRSETRELHGLDSSARIFIYTHKLRETMRPLEVIRGFSRACASFSRSTALVICGDGELRAAAEREARETPGATIVFAGFLSQSALREHLLAADVMVNPAVEPWGCTVNEGLAAGLAMIAADSVVGWPDMVRRDVNGEVYPAGDVNALASLIVRFANAPDLDIETMKRRSLEVAQTELSFATCADGLAAAAAATRRQTSSL